MSDKWVRDTGLVFSLISLFLAYTTGSTAWLGAAAALIALLLFAPAALRPLARVWLFAAELLGRVVGTVLFGLVFFLIVTPIGYVRRLVWGDARFLSLPRDGGSAFTNRSGFITAADIEKPY